MSQLLSAADIYVPKAGEHGQTPVRRVHGRHSTGSSRVGTRPNTLMDMCTDLTAVPHASLSNPSPERSRKVLKNLGGL